MKSAIKKAIVTTLLGISLGFVGMGSAQAQDDLQDYMDAYRAYAAEMPELSYQPEIIDCGIVEKMAAKGALWVMMNPAYVTEESLVAEAEITVGTNDDVVSNMIDHFDNPLAKGAQEMSDTYKSFFIGGAGLEIADYQREPRDYDKMGIKEKRGRAKLIGIQIKTKCESAKKEEWGQQYLKLTVAAYRVMKGEF